ncbi:MAG: D-inositol-3-phosphate glycosyltransferase [bacterium]|nr:D-inositol-3-phosphate glycosyltransferase [bacterium]
MNIAVNGKALGAVEKTGVARVALSLIRHLALLRHDFRFDIFMPRGHVEFNLPANVNIQHGSLKFSDNSFTRSFWEQTILPWQIRRGKQYDILLNLTNSAPVLLSPGVPQILLVHDVGFRNTQWFSNFFSAYLTWVVEAAARQKIRLVTVSQTSAQQLAAMLPHAEAATVVPNDADEPPAALAPKKLDYRYGIFLGSLNPRKNISGAILGFQKFSAVPRREEVRLHVIGGESSIFAALPAALRACRHVVFQGFVTDAEKWALLQGAEFLLLPSFLEGFGLPVLEAFKVGTPVVASNIPVFRELFEDAVEYVDPHSPEDIGRGICEVIDNREKRAGLINRGYTIAKRYSWKIAAEKYVKILEETLRRYEKF